MIRADEMRQRFYGTIALTWLTKLQMVAVGQDRTIDSQDIPEAVDGQDNPEAVLKPDPKPVGGQDNQSSPPSTTSRILKNFEGWSKKVVPDFLRPKKSSGFIKGQWVIDHDRDNPWIKYAAEILTASLSTFQKEELWPFVPGESSSST